MRAYTVASPIRIGAPALRSGARQTGALRPDLTNVIGALAAGQRVPASGGKGVAKCLGGRPVTDADDLDLGLAGGGGQNDDVAGALLEQDAGDGR